MREFADMIMEVLFTLAWVTGVFVGSVIIAILAVAAIHWFTPITPDFVAAFGTAVTSVIGLSALLSTFSIKRLLTTTRSIKRFYYVVR